MKNCTLILSFVAIASISLAQNTRYPLHEMFTSSTCGPCVSGNITLGNVFSANQGEYTCVKYQMNWPGAGDPYYNSYGADRKSFYSVTSVPRLEVDGQWNQNPGQGAYTQSIFNSFQNQTANLSIDVTYTLNNRDIDVDVTINPTADFPQTTNKLFIAVVEKTTYNNAATNGETEFSNVCHLMLPFFSQGTLLSPMTSGTPVTVQSSYTFPVSSDVEEMSDLAVVAWVQDYTNKEVHNSAWATFTTGVSLQDQSGNGISAVYPNPISTYGYMDYKLSGNHHVNVELFNVLGEIVYSNDKGTQSSGMHKEVINANTIPSGIYVMSLSIDDQVYTKKITINR